MAEASLLCVTCGSAPPPHRRTWGRCTVCIERNLPSTYYCGEECMNAHWHNGHKVYHREQHSMEEERHEDPEVRAGDRVRIAERARAAVEEGDEYEQRFAAAYMLMVNSNYHAAAKAVRALIKHHPDDAWPYSLLGMVMQRSYRFVEAAPLYLRAMELFPRGTGGWGRSASEAFLMLKDPTCRTVTKPVWWSPYGLQELSAQVVAAAPQFESVCLMRAFVLEGHAELTGGGLCLKEAAQWHRRAAALAPITAYEVRYEGYARSCDDRLAKEEVKVAETRKAIEAEATKAREDAEQRANAAAEELLAEEAHASQQAADKAAKRKGKKARQQAAAAERARAAAEEARVAAEAEAARIAAEEEEARRAAEETKAEAAAEAARIAAEEEAAQREAKEAAEVAAAVAAADAAEAAAAAAAAEAARVAAEEAERLAAEDDDVPDQFVCPITAEIMSDPVCLSDGFTYERAAIAQWLESHDTSPKTGATLESKMLFPNTSLRITIREHEAGRQA